MEGWLTPFFVTSGEWGPSLSMPRVHLRSAQANEAAATADESFTVGSGVGCALRIDHPDWEEEHLRFTWHTKHASWLVRNLSGGPVSLDDLTLQPGKSEPLLMWRARLTHGGVSLLFSRRPKAPRFGGRPVSEIPLANGLVIGRGRAKDPADTRPRLELDSEMRAISSFQAELEWRGKELYLINRNQTRSSVRTVHNGRQQFDEVKLVIGDCIQIPQCEYYTFKFTGTTLRHVGRGGVLQGDGLTVDVKTGRILHGVNLELPKGTFLGIIGGSGQGKSTLLNSLCGIVPASSGMVMVDGVTLNNPRDVAAAGVGYVPQDDIVHRELRVIDALTYAARLRLKASATQIDAVLNATMETLELSEYRLKRICDLSGGQRKRVSIASELLASPEYLFLDEPTSGLDPQTERDLMGALMQLADNRLMGIACTTHVLQCSQFLDSMAYISRGRLIFHGKPADASRFFLGVEGQGGAGSMSHSNGSVIGGGSSIGSAVHTSGTVAPGGTSGGRDLRTSGDDYLLSKISMIYGKAQNTKQVPQKQDERAAYWEGSYRESPYFVPPAPPVGYAQAEGEEKVPEPVRAVGVGMIRSLMVLLSRQWAVLVSSRLNYLFLLLQAVAIGLMVGWVDDSPVLHMFLCVIATLWFGCSNGAQQVVGELPIFRRERLAGLGINTYLVAKFSFWIFITSVQALILFFTVLLSSHFFHPDVIEGGGIISEEDMLELEKSFGPVARADSASRNFAQSFFDMNDLRWARFLQKSQDALTEQPPLSLADDVESSPSMPAGGSVEGEKTRGTSKPGEQENLTIDGVSLAPTTTKFIPPTDFTIEGVDLPPALQPQAPRPTEKPTDLAGDAMPLEVPKIIPRTVIFNPTGLRFSDPEFRILERLSWFFRVRQNVEDALKVRRIPQSDLEKRELLGLGNGYLSWKRFMVELVGLRLVSLLLAAGVGVGLGLMVSSVVQTPTQAVMWVPLILIPQILFGAFVVTVPDMGEGVYQLSRCLPSFNLQRIMDVALVQGRQMTDMSDESKIPSFKARTPYDSEKVWFGHGSFENYDRVSEVNESWQNLVVDREKLGKRRKIDGKDSVPERADVKLKAGDNADVFNETTLAQPPAMVLGGWIVGCYLIALISLIRRQTGK